MKHIDIAQVVQWKYVRPESEKQKQGETGKETQADCESGLPEFSVGGVECSVHIVVFTYVSIHVAY